MSPNSQQPPQSHTSSSPQLTSSTTSSAATLASILTVALADVERLKLEVEAATNRAVCAENLLRSLAVIEDVTPTTTNFASNTTNINNNNDTKTGFTSPSSLTPAALAALMSAEARATAAESRLAAALDAWSELQRLDDRATDERRRFEDKVADERRKIVNSMEDGTTTGLLSRRSPPSSSFPLLRTESAPLSFASSLSSSSRSRSSISHQPSYSQHVQLNSSFYQQPTHPNTASRTTPYGYQPATAQNASRSHQSQHLYSSQNVYANQPSPKVRIASNSPANVNSISASNRSRSHGASHQQQPPPPPPPQQQQLHAQKGHASTINNNNNRYSEVGVDQDGEGDISMGTGAVDENGRDMSGAPSHSAKEGGTPDHVRHHHRDGQSQARHNTRDRDASADLDTELVGIIYDATSHGHHGHFGGHDDAETEQDPSAVLVDELLDDTSPRSNSNRPPEFEVLPPDEEVDAEGEEDELSNASIDDLLLEVAGGGVGAGLGNGIRERSESGGGITPGPVVNAGGKPGSAAKSNANTKVTVARQAQTQSQSQPQLQTARSKQLKQHLSTSSVLGLNANNAGGGPGSRSPIPPQPSSSSSIGGGSSGLTLTSSNSLTGLTPSLSAQHLFKAAGLPPGGYPAINAQGERTCRQCGQPGRYKDGKCVEKWGPGPEGPGTVCDRCRKKMKRVERRGDANASMLAQAQAQARAEAQQAQAQAAQMSQNATLSAQNSLASVGGRGEKSNNGNKSMLDSRSPRVSPSRSDREKDKEKDKEESIIPAIHNAGNESSPTDASTDMSTDEFMNTKSVMNVDVYI
ncbi:hypothetical protein Clacol_002038 [Clathrus columnatus]|uniref:GATA-type domain-containing protein n=1 Tax=Clathrus columnatus TaxID=1419009 RepID=A0AAV5A2X1_9AGAM|nr:hypothetical protein Clacol_002038 [Clathrus columnatus]